FMTWDCRRCTENFLRDAEKVPLLRRMQERGRLTGERSIVRVLNDCQSWRIVLKQYDGSRRLI
ncbi:hypothetical protein ACW583_004269, partial [Salmonella enterica subsp. enterica serovar Worthington]